MGTEAYRVGGERVCQHTPGRTDRLALAVWREVCPWLAQPERLAEAYRRRRRPDAPTQRPPLALVEAPLGTVRQGGARCMDRDAEGLLDPHALAPRLVRLRQRLAPLDEQRQQLADEAALHSELQRIIGRLDDCATKGHDR